MRIFGSNFMIFIFSPNHVWPEQVPFEVKIPSINDDDDDRVWELNNFANTNSDNEKNPKPVNWRRWRRNFFQKHFFLIATIIECIIVLLGRISRKSYHHLNQFYLDENCFKIRWNEFDVVVLLKNHCSQLQPTYFTTTVE